MRAFRVAACWFAVVLGLGLAWGGEAQAHKPSDSYLTLTLQGPALSGHWDIALRDLDFAIGLDADGDGRITWGEVRTQHAAIAAYAASRLQASVDGAHCPLALGEQLVDEHTDGAYTVVPLHFDCPAAAGGVAPQALTLRYSLFADIDPQHRGLLNLNVAGATRTAIFGPDAALQTFKLAEISRWQQFADYTWEGMWHIWIGFDHILFLLSLLVPAVGVWASRRWQPADHLGSACIEVLRVVTAFTVAHSITLSAAVLGWLTLPSRWVESAIAASVVLAALNNVRPFFDGRRWMVAFVFGLVHGFGFASVLADLGLPPQALVLSLLGFNVGVEAGQLAIVAGFLLLAFPLRRSAFYRHGVLTGGSLLMAAVAMLWLLERVFDLQLMPF